MKEEALPICFGLLVVMVGTNTEKGMKEHHEGIPFFAGMRMPLLMRMN